MHLGQCSSINLAEEGHLYTTNYYKTHVEKARMPKINLEGPLEDTSEMSLKGFQ